MSFKQPMQEIELKIHYKDFYTLPSLDSWLAYAFQIDPQNDPLPPSVAAGEAAIQVENLTYRYLMVLRTLMQLIRIPCFDLGRVLAVRSDHKEPSVWHVTIAVVSVEHVAPACYHSAVATTLHLSEIMMKYPQSEENRNNLYAFIQQKFLIPMKKYTSSMGQSTIPMLQAAHACSIPFMHYGAGIYQLGWGAKARRFDRSATEKDSAWGAKFSDNKIQSSQLLRMGGLPVPTHGLAVTLDEAFKTAEQIGWPVVVKPIDGNRGEGVSIDVVDRKTLRKAMEKAQKYAKDKRIIIEKQVKGVAHRIFTVNGHLLYVVKRLPVSVQGDGTHTVRELIEEANRKNELLPPWMRKNTFPYDKLAADAMQEAGYTPNTVPSKDVWVPLRKIESTADGGIDEEYTETIHPENVTIALRAAKLLGLEVAGVDIISEDISRPWYENGAIINEVNFAPQLGGGEISKRHLPRYFELLIEKEGRIPIHAVVGNTHTMNSAREEQARLNTQGMAAFITSHEETFDPHGEKVVYPFTGLYARCQALLLDQRVEAIILIVQHEEALRGGLPLDTIHHLIETDESSASLLPLLKEYL